jgi:hypothetical protein
VTGIFTSMVVVPTPRHDFELSCDAEHAFAHAGQCEPARRCDGHDVSNNCMQATLAGHSFGNVLYRNQDAAWWRSSMNTHTNRYAIRQLLDIGQGVFDQPEDRQFNVWT